MADDTPTVEEAKAWLISFIRALTPNNAATQRQKEQTAQAFIDALIAAVRAEKDEAHRLDQSFYALMNQKPDEETS